MPVGQMRDIIYEEPMLRLLIALQPYTAPAECRARGFLAPRVYAQIDLVVLDLGKSHGHSIGLVAVPDEAIGIIDLL